MFPVVALVVVDRFLEELFLGANVIGGLPLLFLFLSLLAKICRANEDIFSI
ncbi:hypothetical protein D3C80_2173250 [compost metagenome]